MIFFHASILLCQIFSFNGLQTRMSADRSCNRMFTAGISRNHDNCTSLPPSLKLNCAARRLLFSWENVREAISLNHDTSPYTLYYWLSGYEIHDIEIPDYAFPVLSCQQGRLPVTVHVQFHVPFQCLVAARMPACRMRSMSVPSSRSSVWRAWDCSGSERWSVVMNLESRSMSSKVTPLARCGSGRST